MTRHPTSRNVYFTEDNEVASDFVKNLFYGG